jgi:hypothetical protein
MASPTYPGTENLRGNPFRLRAKGLYLVGHRAIRSKGACFRGRGLNATPTSLCPQPTRVASRLNGEVRE